MLDKDKDGMSPKAAGGQKGGNPSMTGSSDNQYSSSGMNAPSGQQADGSGSGGGATQMADKAKQQAKSMASQAAEQGKTVINQQKDSVVQQVDSVSGAIRGAADQLRQDGQAQTGHYIGMLADQLETFGRQLRNKDANTLIRDMENLSRRAPVTFFAGALAAGFVAARFLKSSAERSPSEYGSNSFSGSHSEGSQSDDSYSWRNEMGEGDHDVNVRSNRTQSLDAGRSSLMADSAASGTLGGQWGAGTNVAGPEITGIYRPSDAKASTTGTELPGSAQPAVSADGKAQPGRPTEPIGGSTKSSSSTEPTKSGGNIYGNR